MASDATQPESAAAGSDASDTAALPPVTQRVRSRHRKRTSVLAMIRAELSVMFFMAGLGMWSCLVILSVVFPFNDVVDDMGRASIYITALAALTVVLLAVAIPSFWKESGWRGVLLPFVLILAMAGNWLGWFYHFNLVLQVKQFFN